MRDIKEIRFVATNYFNLQGLRVIPLGLSVILVIYWANAQQGSARNYLLPVCGLIGFSILYYAIDRYYLRVFGRVQRTPESRRLEWLLSIVGGILAIGALWFDLYYKLPVCLIGLVFSAGLLADYIRMTWLVKGRFLIYYPLGAVLMAGVSILNLLGIHHWWQWFGLKAQLLGIAMVIGLFTIIAGIWGHIYLTRTLSSRVELKK